jgi:hypothetical protein
VVLLVGGLAARNAVTSRATGAWDARIVDLVRFVEDERELTFKHPVKVKFLTEAEFRTAVGKTRFKPRAPASHRLAKGYFEPVVSYPPRTASKRRKPIL